MTCKGSVVLWFVLPKKKILVIHRSELDSIGRNAYISCSLANTVRHDTNHVQAAITGSRAMLKMGGGNDEGGCYTAGVDVTASVTCQTGRLVDCEYIHNTCEILSHQSLTISPRPNIMALPCTESLGFLIIRRNAISDLSSYRYTPLIPTEVSIQSPERAKAFAPKS